MKKTPLLADNMRDSRFRVRFHCAVGRNGSVKNFSLRKRGSCRKRNETIERLRRLSMRFYCNFLEERKGEGIEIIRNIRWMTNFKFTNREINREWNGKKCRV